MRFAFVPRVVVLAVLGFGVIAALGAGLILSPARGRAQGAAGCSGGPYAEVQIDGTPRLNLELARTAQEHEVGLMYRDALPPDNGMLFIYQAQAGESYWMLHTLIPLSIAWIDRNGTIVDIQDMPRLNNPDDVDEASHTLYTPAAPYWYALEVNEGWFLDHGVGVGQQISFCLGS